MEEKNTILEIKDFYQSYNDVPVVTNLSLDLLEGEILGFIGHNGAGKSTTIKSIVGILAPLKGKIIINGMDISSSRKECQKIMSYIPDNPDLYSYMSGIEYINFICDIYMVGEEREARIKQIATDFEIYEFLGNLISSYSHGMKQKVALIAAFVHNPKLLVLDEPFVGLDPNAIIVLKRYMKKLCAEGGAIFFSSHVLDILEKFCDKIVMIDHGKLIFNKRIEELPKNKNLEEIFLESINKYENI